MSLAKPVSKLAMLTVPPQAALSDEENSESEGDIAPKLPKAAQNGADDDEEDDGEGEEELFVVSRWLNLRPVLSHVQI